MDGRRALARAALRPRERRPALPPLDTLSLVRPYRAAVVRLRLGDPALRNRLPRDLPRSALRSAAVPVSSAIGSRALALALARAPHPPRRGADQAARGSLLARPHLPRLPLRDPADPQSFEPSVPPSAALAPARRCALQSPRRARCSVVRIRAVEARATHGRRRDARLAGAADPERKPLVPELADDRSSLASTTLSSRASCPERS